MSTCPIPIKQLGADIEGVPTKFVLQSYSDRLFLIVTQFDKIGSMLEGSKAQSAQGNDTYIVNTLLGDRAGDEFYSVLARRLTEAFTQTVELPILFGLALKTQTPQAFKEIVAFVKDQQLC
eukprot:GFYU01008879.1.p1 GENE.GFYU01008879.1~~GFYU01008879.1.p1  ORF type:complete len:121 (-),score=6.03 GFYU01008879.1:30-392(-)